MAENKKEIKLEEDEILRISIREVKPDAAGHNIRIIITKASEDDDFVNDVADIFAEAMENEFEDFVPIDDEDEI